MGHRDPVLEQIILSSNKILLSDCCWLYAQDVIEGRWIEAEPIMIKNASSCDIIIQYAMQFRPGIHWPELEELIFSTHDGEAMMSYLIGVLKGRWVEGEKNLYESEPLDNGYTLWNWFLEWGLFKSSFKDEFKDKTLDEIYEKYPDICNQIDFNWKKEEVTS
jgi:hypothetical protein